MAKARSSVQDVKKPTTASIRRQGAPSWLDGQRYRFALVVSLTRHLLRSIFRQLKHHHF